MQKTERGTNSQSGSGVKQRLRGVAKVDGDFGQQNGTCDDDVCYSNMATVDAECKKPKTMKISKTGNASIEDDDDDDDDDDGNDISQRLTGVSTATKNNHEVQGE